MFSQRDELIKQEPAKEKPAKEKKQSDGENVKSKKSKQAQPAVENVAPVAEKKEEKKIVEKKDEKKIVEKKEEKKIVEKKDEKKSVDKKDDKKTAPPDVEKKEEKKLEAAPAPSQVNGLPVNTAKEKKKKKSEFNTLQQLSKYIGRLYLRFLYGVDGMLPSSILLSVEQMFPSRTLTY